VSAPAVGAIFYRIRGRNSIYDAPKAADNLAVRSYRDHPNRSACDRLDRDWPAIHDKRMESIRAKLRTRA
jgi:hypothetical protein